MSARPLDIIIPIYRNAELVRACIDSVLANLGEIAGREPRLLLINDSPDDAQVNALLLTYRGRAPALQLLHNERNLGFVQTANRGLALAQRDGHDALLGNSDTVTFEGTLRELLAAADGDPQIGFACPRSNNASICSLPHHHGGALPTPEQARQRWALAARTLPAWHFAPTAVGFYLFIAHRVLANFGGLSEDFGLGYEEENDLVMRAGKVGLRAVIANHSFAYHAGSASFSLTGIDLPGHKLQNLQKMAGQHPEFLPLVRRYEDSPHYRAERLMGGLLPDAQGRIKLVFDLTGLGKHHNGTNEQAVAVMRSLARRHGQRIRLAAIASAESFRFHGLDQVAGLHREEPSAPGLHAVAVRMAQPFALHHLNLLEGLAPVNLFSMLDTIAEDCGPLAAVADVAVMWEHVAEHANGVFFNSLVSELPYCNRHPAARALPRWARLLPTRIGEYAKAQPSGAASHIFVPGNHFAHKGSETAALALARAYPTLEVVTLGAEHRQAGNLTCLRAGQLEPAQVEGLFCNASIVVLPSYAEGFGFAFMHALAAGRPIAARRLPATEEILATLDQVQGVFLFDDDEGLVAACQQALRAGVSSASDARTQDWDAWADELAEFCLSMTTRGDIFPRLVRRIAAGDRLRRTAVAERQPTPVPPPAPPATVAGEARSTDLASLLALDGRTFVEHAYMTLLQRAADPSGLDFYLAELQRGVHKAVILDTLSRSAEGREREARLEGLDEALSSLPRPRRPLLRRLLGH